MASQSFSTPAGRNQFKAASIPSKVPVGSGHASTVKASMHAAAPPAAGSAVRGFSGSGMLKAKIKA